jgi:predicted amidohydrolase YtcJ
MSEHAGAPATEGPILLTGARVLDPDRRPLAEDSVAVAGGRILAVGRRDDVVASLPSDHAVVDLAQHPGATVVPGLVDSHLHPMPLCFFEHHLDLASCTSLDELFDALRDGATRPDLDAEGREWVVGLRLDDERLRERRLPTRVELDAVADGRPVVILRRDGHHAIGSTAALEAAGFHPGCEDPPGGVVHRAADGSLTGLCGEAASSLLLAPVPLPAWDDLAAALDRAVARMAGHGITAISAMCQTTAEGPAGAAGELEAVGWSMLLDRVPFDIQTIVIGAGPAEVAALRSSPLHDPAGRRRLDAVKIFLDGTLGGRTACLHRPYADADGCGMLTLDPDAAYGRMVDAHLAGLQVCVHAIGDRANAAAVDLFGRLLAEHPGPHRHRIEHASVLDPGTVDRFAELGLSAVVQPISIESERPWLAGRLGPERLDRVYPFRRLLDAGVVVAGSSDAPIEELDALRAMACAVDRQGIAPDQEISADEALALYTTGAAWVRGTDADTGRVEPGRHADLAVLSAPPGRDDGTEVLLTVAGGRVLHDRRR